MADVTTIASWSPLRPLKIGALQDAKVLDSIDHRDAKLSGNNFPRVTFLERGDPLCSLLTLADFLPLLIKIFFFYLPPGPLDGDTFIEAGKSPITTATSADRLWKDIHSTAKCGSLPQTPTGMSRLALTDEDQRVRDWFMEESEAARVHSQG
jgi:hypothetical protein